jgi:hypothetical protein
MSDERFDFSAFDLERDSERVERMVGNVMWRARGELARRARGQSLTITEAVAAWFRPAIAVAAAIAGISLTMLATAGRSDTDLQAGAYVSSAEIPAAMTAWYEEDRSPTASDLLVATHGDDQ